jgi:hypothetical protein
MSLIKYIHARQILDSRGNPTVEVDVLSDNEYLESLYACNDDRETEVIINFLKIVQNRIWAMIVSIEQTIWEYNLRLLSPISKGESDKDKDLVSAVNMKSKMAEDLGIMNDRLDGYLKMRNIDCWSKKNSNQIFGVRDADKIFGKSEDDLLAACF